MSTLPVAVDAIYKDWQTFIGTSAPFTFPGEDPVVASTRKKLDEGTQPWYRVSFREAGGGRSNLNGDVGTRRYVRLGFLAIQCFAPTNAGSKAALQMAEAARTYFEDRRLTREIIYLNATVRGQPPDGRWDSALLEVEVEFTEFK